MRKFSVAIIGLGNIGQGYDYSSDRCENILTHATGFTCHEGFDLIGGVDPDPEQCKRFEKKFNLPSYTDLNSLMLKHIPAVFALGIPTEVHFQVFEDVIHCQPVAILCEKPIASTINEANKMVALAEKHQCSLLVNYSRRFQPGMLALKNKIQNGEIGKIYKGTVWYTKGFLNNASHFVDLLRFLFGEVTEINILKKGRKWDEKDPEPDVCLSFEDIHIYFLSGRHECFTLNSMELLGTSGLIQYKNGGSQIDLFKTQTHPVYSGYTVLSSDSQTIPVDVHRSQWHPIEALYCHLTKKIPLNSDGKSAKKTLNVIQQILELL